MRARSGPASGRPPGFLKICCAKRCIITVLRETPYEPAMRRKIGADSKKGKTGRRSNALPRRALCSGALPEPRDEEAGRPVSSREPQRGVQKRQSVRGFAMDAGRYLDPHSGLSVPSRQSE